MPDVGAMNVTYFNDNKLTKRSINNVINRTNYVQYNMKAYLITYNLMISLHYDLIFLISIQSNDLSDIYFIK